MTGEIVVITLFLGAFAMIFGLRYFSNKEKMAMIERGMNPGVLKSSPQPFLSLKFGLLLMGLGLGLLIAMIFATSLYGDRFLDNSAHNHVVSLYFGSLGLFGGLGLVISYYIEKKWLEKTGNI